MYRRSFPDKNSTKNESTNYRPLVSIITPVFNSIKYLETSIKSVLNQSYTNIEHVFVDGCSTDGTLDVLKKYSSKYPGRIRFISEPDKGKGFAWNGAVAAWNKGWKIAEGDIFGWLGADDMLEPDAVMTVVEFFRVNPNAHFVFGACNVIDEKGDVVYEGGTKDFDLEHMINDGNPISSTSVFYRRKVIERIGFLDTSINSADYDYWIRVGKVFQIRRIDKTLRALESIKGALADPKELCICTQWRVSSSACGMEVLSCRTIPEDFLPCYFSAPL